MARTVGSVEFVVGADGTTFERQLRKAVSGAASRAGITAGKEFSAGFSDGTSRLGRSLDSSFSGNRFERIGITAGKSFSSGFARQIARLPQGNLFGGMTEDIGELRQVFPELERGIENLSSAAEKNVIVWQESGDAADSFGRKLKDVDNNVRSTDSVLSRLGGKIRGFWDDLDAGTVSLQKNSGGWRSMSQNARQWTLIIAAVAAGMEELAGLGSAAGAGLFALGGALSTVVVGGAGAIAVFSSLLTSVEKLPAGMRDVATEFRSFLTSLKSARDVISSSAFDKMAGTFKRLEGTVEGLSPVLGKLGTSVGRVFDSFSRGVEQGSEGFDELNKLISNAADNLGPLSRAAGTWALALIRGLNKANPLTNQLVGYIQKLGDRFDAFTRSNSFDTWIKTASTTFSHLGVLLDATGRALNDLVTPETIADLNFFIDGLTGFMPSLTRILQIVGELNVFGVAAQALSMFGAALSPLYGPLEDLAGALSDIVTSILPPFAQALGTMATAIAPIVQGIADFAKGMADFIGAAPPQVLASIAGGIVAIGIAIKGLRGFQAFSGLAEQVLYTKTQMSGLAGAAGTASTKAGGLASKISGFVGKAGIFGAIAGAVIGLGVALFEASKEWSGLNDKMAETVTGAGSFADAYDTLNTQQGYFADSLADTDINSFLSDMDKADNIFKDYARAMGESGQEMAVFGDTINELDTPLSELAQTNLPAAAQRFADFAKELGVTQANMPELLDQFSEYKEVLAASAGSQGMATDNQSLLNYSMAQGIQTTSSYSSALDLVYNSASLSGAEIAALGEKMRTFSEQALTSRSAARDYEAAIDGLTESVKVNGTTLDISTEKGRNNQAAIDNLAAATLASSEATKERTGSEKAANDVVAKGREQLIKMLAQFGITGAAADKYADELGLIPTDVTTRVALKGAQEAEDRLNAMQKDRTVRYHVVVDSSGATNIKGGGHVVSPYASGGVLSGPRHILAGEAGPEAIVPLRRNLNQVDPSVRWLSAIAQGRSAPAMASGGVVGSGRTNVIESGAIVVNDATSPLATAVAVLDRLSYNLA